MLLAILAVIGLGVGYGLGGLSTAREATPAKLAELDTRSELRLSEIEPRRIAQLLAVRDADLIAESLAVRLYLDGGASAFSAIERPLMARFVVQSEIPADRQIEIYVNTAPINGATGFAEASRQMFGKDFADLSDPEYARLLGALPR